MKIYNKVLIALDVFAEYEKVLETGLQSTELNNVELIYVVPPAVYFEPYVGAIEPDLIGEAQKQATAKLNDIAKANDVPQERVHLPIGAPADEIHAIAEKIGADLIVIGTHGQSGLQLLLGSTANSVLHGAKNDVLCVRV